jgi:hypothetical protein
MRHRGWTRTARTSLWYRGWANKRIGVVYMPWGNSLWYLVRKRGRLRHGPFRTLTEAIEFAEGRSRP